MIKTLRLCPYPIGIGLEWIPVAVGVRGVGGVENDIVGEDWNDQEVLGEDKSLFVQNKQRCLPCDRSKLHVQDGIFRGENGIFELEYPIDKRTRLSTRSNAALIHTLRVKEYTQK